LQKQNPESPEWEWQLVEKVRKETLLLDTHDVVNLKGLQKHRHLSAHPILTGSATLYSPTKEVCRAHIRNAMEGILTKPPMMSRKVFDTLLEDLETNQLLLPDDTSLNLYL